MALREGEGLLLVALHLPSKHHQGPRFTWLWWIAVTGAAPHSLRDWQGLCVDREPQHVHHQASSMESPQVCHYSRTPGSYAFLLLLVVSVTLLFSPQRNVSAAKLFLTTINVDYDFWHAPFMTTSPSGCVRESGHKGSPAASQELQCNLTHSHTPSFTLAELQTSPLLPGSGWSCCLVNNSFASRQDEQRNGGSGYSRLAQCFPQSKGIDCI